MEFTDPKLNHAFDPLKVVDIETLNSVAANFKNSRDKSKRAIGVFLDRINRLRSTAPAGKRGQEPTTKSTILKSTGLKDLAE